MTSEPSRHDARAFPTTDGSSDLPTAVVVTRTRWTEMPRLRHEVARALAREYRVLFVETPLGWRGRSPTRISEVEPNILRCQLSERLTLPERARFFVPGANAFVQQRLLREIYRCLAEIGSTSTVLVNFNHDATRVMGGGRFSAKLYICNDDWTAKADGALRKRVVTRQEAVVAQQADVCLAVSYPLVAKLERWNLATRLFLPGHDIQVKEGEREPREPRSLIRVLFMGNVNRRIEPGWLSEVARQDDMEMHTVGTVKLDSSDVTALRAAGVELREPLYGEQLQTALEDADVLVIPYRLLDDVLAVTASNKLFKYIAAEKPVVISNMPHFIDFGPGIIYRADSPEAFVTQIRRAAAEDGATLRERRRVIARESGWEQRGEELRRLVAEAVLSGMG